MGSFDIFYSDRLDDSWRNWSKPVNLGSDINSEGRELFYREFGDLAYMTTTLNSDGYADIRMHSRPIQTPQPEVAKTLPVATQTQTGNIQELKYENADSAKAAITTITGKIVNSSTNEVIPGGSIQFHAGDKMIDVVADEEGNFKTYLAGMREYHVKVEGKGFIGRFEKLDLRTHVMKDMVMNFSLKPIEVGTTVNLKSVLFVQSKPLLLEESYDELDMVVDFMKLNPNVAIELSGHTDNRGRHDMNMKLSRERVDAVKAYIVDQGVDGKRISGKGYGGTRPIADNEAEETRALNRRVEFTILKN